MRVTRRRRGLLVVFGALGALGAYHLVVRPRHLHWGAKAQEANRPMPGDDVVVHPYVITTRAVTIGATPDDVWPWLVQIGAGRAGLYSYDWLDRLFGFIHGPSADRIVPEFQQLTVGDVIPMGRGPSWPVNFLERHRALVLEPVPGRVTWSFGLYPFDGSTRLVSRVRMRLYAKPVVWLAAPAIDSAWLLMERKMLLGIKSRAESVTRPPLSPANPLAGGCGSKHLRPHAI